MIQEEISEMGYVGACGWVEGKFCKIRKLWVQTELLSGPANSAGKSWGGGSFLPLA